LSWPIASTFEGSARFASSEGSNFSSSSMLAALGAVPRVAGERDDFELDDLDVELRLLVFRVEGFFAPELRELEDLELPPDLRCAIPRQPYRRRADSASLRAPLGHAKVNGLKSDQD
jgi:hypothetical protein